MQTENNFVSVFASAKHTQPQFSDLSVRNALMWFKDDAMKLLIDQIRNEPDKDARQQLKQKLSAITFSGTFRERRASELIVHSGFICIDVDNISDLEETKKIVNSDPYTYASFVSASGTGLAFLVKIDTDKHLQSFLQIERYYAQKGITIDKSCKDVCRLRYVTYDQDLYLYEKSLVWDIFIEEPKKAKQPKKEYPKRIHFNTSSTAELVEKVVSRIEDTHTNLTQNYDDWIAIGLALNAEFGAAGEEWFHRISAIDHRYNQDETTDKYRNTNNPYCITIAKFFKIAKQYGINTRFKETQVYS
jgi:hypothetical protein